MLSTTVEVKSSKNDVLSRIEKALPVALEKVLQEGQKIALNNKRGNKDADLIQYSIKIGKGEVEGRIYTTFNYAPFLEYGTGNKSDGSLPHIGKTKTFFNSGMQYWYLPKRIAESSGMSFNPNRLIKIKGEEFYIMYATQPYPFMRPTAFELETKATETIKQELLKHLGG